MEPSFSPQIPIYISMPLFLPDFGEEIVAKIFYADNGFDSDFYNDMAWKGLTGPKAFMMLSDTKIKV